MSSEAAPNSPLQGEGDRAKRGEGGSWPLPRPIVARARQLRKQMMPPEVALWQYLRQRPGGLKFRKQHPVTNEIVADFFCVSAGLVIEVDGVVHDNHEAVSKDVKRDAVFARLGLRAFRIKAADVLNDTAASANAIVAFADSPHHHPADGPPPHSGED